MCDSECMCDSEFMFDSEICLQRVHATFCIPYGLSLCRALSVQSLWYSSIPCMLAISGMDSYTECNSLKRMRCIGSMGWTRTQNEMHWINGMYLFFHRMKCIGSMGWTRKQNEMHLINGMDLYTE